MCEFWDNGNYKAIGDFIKNTLSVVFTTVDKETIDFVEHYLRYGEYEMAFEGLFIEIMNLETPPQIDFGESLSVALKLKLNEDSIFDDNFWEKFQAYVNKHMQH